MTTYWLSMHVPYACRHSGVCCSSGWPIPIERSRVAPLRLLRRDDGWLVPAADAPPDVAGLLATDRHGRCVFHRQPEGERAVGCCEIQRELGPSALPSACQHFPRQILFDPRGVFVTLSHYCPTAASLLFAHAGPVTIVAGPSPSSADDPEGLDARDVLPPLLRAGLLMDHAAYSLWEGHIVRRLTTSDHGPDRIVMTLARHAHALSRWRPGDGELTAAVTALDALAEPTQETDPDWPFERQLFAYGLDSLPTHGWPGYPDDAEQEWHRGIAREWTANRHVINRFLAAHAFASWMAYQGSGVVSQIMRLRLTLAVLRAEVIRRARAEGSSSTCLKDAIRHADLLMVHLVDRTRLARRLSA